MVEVQHLVKRYGVKNAVDDISFSIDSGEIVGFLGPNGAGKSTTMNILTGYISATQGTAKIGGFDILEEPMEAKKCIGYLPEQPPLYLDMTVDAYLQFMFELKKVKLPRKEHLHEVCALCGIEGVRQRIIKNLSKGYRQRVGLAQALLGNPQVLILDEPTVGLDPNQIIEIRGLIQSLGKRHTIILSSHILSEVQAVCDRIIILSDGRLIADGTPESIAATLSTDHSLTARIEGDCERVQRVLRGLGSDVQVTVEGRRENESGAEIYDYRVTSTERRDLRRDLFAALCREQMPLLLLKTSELTLEEVFLQLIEEQHAAPAAGEAPTSGVKDSGSQMGDAPAEDGLKKETAANGDQAGEAAGGEGTARPSGSEADTGAGEAQGAPDENGTETAVKAPDGPDTRKAATGSGATREREGQSL
ncbi:ATP-binding cassette domain-containing protein [Zongyangia hominis]|uniref:ATP-binding cassette domain-containing protein n=1 Tax=Zongyangia hominis TaxID=2763677 RepID=A0A926IBP0_9FIRM|nr:ATP-binding cassette domain-containing protein [Zongyangia hominis]MBC8571441.1 ATP-binding cassette domain-containing protein [Zongyangia hominis]